MIIREMPNIFPMVPEDTNFEDKESIQATLPSDLQIVSRLGSGSFGTVYRVMTCGDSVHRALKLMHRENMDQGVPLTVVREAALLQTLQPHRNIVKLVRVVFTDKAIGFMLELCAMDLFTYIARKNRLSTEEQQGLTRQLLEVIFFLWFLAFVLVDSPFPGRFLHAFSPRGAPRSEAKALDVWSVGCIVAELVDAYSLFTTTSASPTQFEALMMIFRLCGTPDEVCVFCL